MPVGEGIGCFEAGKGQIKRMCAENGGVQRVVTCRIIQYASDGLRSLLKTGVFGQALNILKPKNRVAQLEFFQDNFQDLLSWLRAIGFL